MKAVAPSRASSDSRTGSVISHCLSNISARPHSGASTMTCFEARTARGPFAAIARPSSSAASSAPPVGVSRKCWASSMPSATPYPSGTSSRMLSRMPTVIDVPTTSRIARRHSVAKPARFSSDPPYASSRRLVKGERNHSCRSSWLRCSSTPSARPSIARRAEWAYSATKASMSSVSMTCGIRLMTGALMTLDAPWGMPPWCTICTVTVESSAWSASQ